MRRIICFIMCMCCLLINGTAAARITRGDDIPLTVQTAQQGDAKINFVREFSSRHEYTEIQHIMRGNEDYTLLHIQGWYPMTVSNNLQNMTLQFCQGKTVVKSIDLQPINSLGRYIPNGVDQWYNADDLAEWIALSKTKGMTVNFVNNNSYDRKGKPLCFDETEFFKEAAKMMTLTKDSPVTYGPMYSVFFPGKKWTEVRDAFVYHLNSQSDCHWDFSYNNTDHTIGINPYNDINVHSYIKFIELPTGTWMNWDMWHQYYVSDCNAYEYEEAEETGYISNLVNIWHIVHQTYDVLVPHSDYGIKLADDANMYSTPRIASVDVKNYPELACISEGDKIIQINGKDVSKTPTYAVDYLLNYSQGNPDIRLTLKHSKDSVYDITLKGKSCEPNVENIDYDAVNTQKGNKHYDTTDIPLSYIPNCYAPYEIYDPKGPQDVNLESPGPIYDLTH